MPTHVLYSLAGAGGRLIFHEIVRTGRLPEVKDVSWVETGTGITDFTIDPFDSFRFITVTNMLSRRGTFRKHPELAEAALVMIAALL